MFITVEPVQPEESGYVEVQSITRDSNGLVVTSIQVGSGEPSQINAVEIIGVVLQGDKGEKGDPGAPGSGGSSGSASIVATEAINQFDIVTGSGKRATSDNVTHRNKIVGIALNGIVNGFSGYVQTGGTVTNSSWRWVMGDRIFLNGYLLSTVAPLTGFIVQVGVATASDTVNIEIQPSILL